MTSQQASAAVAATTGGTTNGSNVQVQYAVYVIP
jgi:hypothetical protein